MGLTFEKAEALRADFNKRMEAATSSYSTTTDFSQYIFSCLWLRIIRNCLVHEFSLTDIFNHGYRAVILKKNSFWLLPIYMAVASYCYY